MERGERGEHVVLAPVGEGREHGECGGEVGGGTELAEGFGGDDAHVGRGVGERADKFGARATHDGGAAHVQTDGAPIADGAVGVGEEFF